ncbi:predicted protein [Aspergillus nidulans FGSC A4]|nr:predicted protein [Aspergillus nidulans FGSC A4]|eukprot:XP_660421.1 predicted protein [Aspergillus nidulans FGSC A4]
MSEHTALGYSMRGCRSAGVDLAQSSPSKLLKNTEAYLKSLDARESSLSQDFHQSATDSAAVHSSTLTQSIELNQLPTAAGAEPEASMDRDEAIFLPRDRTELRPGMIDEPPLSILNRLSDNQTESGRYRSADHEYNADIESLVHDQSEIGSIFSEGSILSSQSSQSEITSIAVSELAETSDRQ